MRPGDTTPLVPAGADVKLSPGVSYSAIVLGTRGEELRVVALTDRGAPLTRPQRKPGASSGSSPGIIEVKRGDSLWSIARGLVGPAASNEAVEHKLVAIWDLNAKRIGTGDPNLIFAGTRLRVPS
jgi:Tfp pilus assembly protein FimV